MTQKKDTKGAAMYKIFKAIESLRNDGLVAVGSRIRTIVGKSRCCVLRLLKVYWEWGYLARKPTQDRTHGTVANCMWHWKFTAKGLRKYAQLRAEFEN